MSVESDHHCNFVSFMKDTFSEPFTQGGVFHQNYSPAKYSKDADQDLPFIYGNEGFHFHRHVKSLWQLSPGPSDVIFEEIN
jgi:hypothetical protein